MSNHILDSLGLTKNQVQKAFGCENTPETIVEKKNYLCASDQKRIRRRLKAYKNFIIARFKEGYRPKQIALMLNVSEESVRSRLRKANLFGKDKKAGRPRSKASKQSCSHLSLFAQDHSFLEEKVYLNQSLAM